MNLEHTEPSLDRAGQRSLRANKGAILLVDDDAALVRGVSRVLRARGYDVTPAGSGDEAVRLVKEGKFDVVVSDIAMPGKDGIRLLRELRETDLLVPIVLLTGVPAISTAAQAVEYGAFRYLTKPVETEELLRVLDQGVHYHRVARMKARAAELLGTGIGPGDRAGLEASFERVLDTLYIAYQPIVRPSTREVFGHEALLRTNEPSLPHPGAVLGAAERLGRLQELGRTIRQRAAVPFADGTVSGLLFVNLHVRDLLDPTLWSTTAPLSAIAHRVVLEVTERAALDEVNDVRAKVARLREMGFRIAVDDLGAGYAGLTSFAQLEPEVVKLDMSLVRDVDTSVTKQRVVRSMTSLCLDMGMLVVAEGVETSAERDTLLELNCELLQGYLFAKPGAAFPAVCW